MANKSSLRVPKYRLHKPSGRAVVRIAGRDYYLGRHGTKSSKVEYNRIVAEYLQRGGIAADTSRSDLSVAEVLAAYIRYAKRYYRKNGKPTREFGHIRTCCREVRKLYGKTPAVDFGPLAMKSVRQLFVESGVSRTHVNQQTNKIKRIFRWAAAEELIPASVPQALSMVEGLRKGRSVAPDNPPVFPVEDSMIDVTLQHLPAVVADMVRLQRLTGMRPAELCMIRPCDIDRSGDVWLYRPESHKTEHHGRERVVPIGPRGQEVLLRYLARDAAAYCFRPCDSEAKRLADRHSARKTPMSCGNKPGSNRKRKPKRQAGLYYSSCSYRRAIYRACDKAFPHPQLGSIVRRSFTDAEKDTLKKWQRKYQWAPNRLRHSAGTEIRREFGLEAAQVVLGHSQANITQVYAERDMAKGIEVAAKIG